METGRYLSFSLIAVFCLSQVFLNLNLNEALNVVLLSPRVEEKSRGVLTRRLPWATQMFQIPSLITLTITETQIYCSTPPSRPNRHS
ncbi:hypothetical protein BGW80DRAFT_1300967 [Lactifluus volemus]|nr:hypothetical protein BGW80DRAFT_1300967 [Lactifluus volemus]